MARIAEDPKKAAALIPVGDPGRIEAGWYDDDALRAFAAPYADHPDYAIVEKDRSTK